MTKILFLDHDGVIIPFIRNKPDQKIANIINEIIDKTNCEIVVTSDWKYSYSLDELGDLYERWGFNKRPIDITGTRDIGIASSRREVLGYNQMRENDILHYVNANNIEPWCAVDDLVLDKLGDRFVECNKPFDLGIKEGGLKDRVIEILNS